MIHPFDRRTFMKLSILATAGTACSHIGNRHSGGNLQPGSGSRYDLLQITADTYYDLGFQVGRVFRKNIRQVIKRRGDWFDGLMSAMKTERGRIMSDEMRRLTRKHFPHLIDEITGMSDGAGLDFNALWAMSVKSELASLDPEPPGCSTIAVMGGKDRWLWHNEDGHSAYRGLAFVLGATPPSGIRFTSLVYPGIITGNGPSFNDRGIIQTTNYIGSTRPEPGIPRYILGRAVLEAKTLDEAVQIVTMSPRAYPCHHNLASVSTGRYLSVETVPGIHQAEEPTGIYIHTNHLQHNRTIGYRHEDESYRSVSSQSRYDVIHDELKKGHPTSRPEDLLSILASHRNAPYSPCRHPDGEVRGLTLGTAFYDIPAGKFYLHKGNPCSDLPLHDYHQA